MTWEYPRIFKTCYLSKMFINIAQLRKSNILWYLYVYRRFCSKADLEHRNLQFLQLLCINVPNIEVLKKSTSRLKMVLLKVFDIP